MRSSLSSIWNVNGKMSVPEDTTESREARGSIDYDNPENNDSTDSPSKEVTCLFYDNLFC